MNEEGRKRNICQGKVGIGSELKRQCNEILHILQIVVSAGSCNTYVGSN